MVAKPSKVLEQIAEEERKAKEAFDKKKAQLKAKKQDALAKQRKQARKDLTRKKILVGAIAMDRMGTDPEFAEAMNAMLRDRIQERDRKHFPDLFPVESE